MNKYVVVVLLLVVSVLSGLSQADITNIDFTQGLDGLDYWNPTGNVSVVWYPDPGANYARFLEYGDSTSSISQLFFVPGDAQYLSFNVDLYSMDDPTTDTFTATLAGVNILSISNHDAPLNQAIQVDVLSLAGHNVWLEFALSSDSTNGGSTEVFIGQLTLAVDSIPIVPVPPAMLLGGLGVASVNWLRRRRIL